MEKVWINGSFYKISEFSGEKKKIDLPETEKNIISFILDWHAGKTHFLLNTSGSTGEPKSIYIKREHMIASARMTLKHLGITSNHNIFLCLDPIYIAGIMQIVRAMVGKCNLYARTPSSMPFEKKLPDADIHLCSLVPIQVINTIENEYHCSQFQSIHNILIGGGPLNEKLEENLKSMENNIFHTFGMTETVTHIALRKLTGKNRSNHFKVLKGIQIKANDQDCLQIKGEITDQSWITTNDIITLIDADSFIWKGRYDHIINSGGKKTVVEVLEKKITSILNKNNIQADFIIAGKPDKRLGEIIVMIIESRQFEGLERIKKLLSTGLDKFEKPKEYFSVNKLQIANQNKINRKDLLKIANRA